MIKDRSDEAVEEALLAGIRLSKTITLAANDPVIAAFCGRGPPCRILQLRNTAGSTQDHLQNAHAGRIRSFSTLEKA
jgi:hypothetical protein